jgi:hypothetical protein
MLIFDKRFTIIISLYKIIHNITGPPHPTMHRGSSTPFVRVAHVQQLHVVRPSCPCTIAPCPFIRAAHVQQLHASLVLDVRSKIREMVEMGGSMRG